MRWDYTHFFLLNYPFVAHKKAAQAISSSTTVLLCHSFCCHPRSRLNQTKAKNQTLPLMCRPHPTLAHSATAGVKGLKDPQASASPQISCPKPEWPPWQTCWIFNEILSKMEEGTTWLMVPIPRKNLLDWSFKAWHLHNSAQTCSYHALQGNLDAALVHSWFSLPFIPDAYRRSVQDVLLHASSRQQLQVNHACPCHNFTFDDVQKNKRNTAMQFILSDIGFQWRSER